MAHFVKIENGKAEQVIVISNNDCAGGEFPTSEPAGQTFIASLGLTGEWLQCSYNNNFRGIYPHGVGYSYDAINDVFVAPLPTPKPEQP